MPVWPGSRCGRPWSRPGRPVLTGSRSACLVLPARESGKGASRWGSCGDQHAGGRARRKTPRGRWPPARAAGHERPAGRRARPACRFNAESGELLLHAGSDNWATQARLDAAGCARFVVTDVAPLGYDDGAAFCWRLPELAGVAAVPVSVFCADPDLGRTLVRFAFCKREDVLVEAVSRLSALT